MAGRKRPLRGPTKELTTVREQVEATRAFVTRYQDRVLDLLRQDQNAVKRFYQTFSICLAQEPKLATCTRASLIGAMLEIASLGLEPGVLGEAWLIPFKDRKRNVTEAQVVIGYKGMLELARSSGRVGRIDSEVVFEKDPFDWQKGTEQFVHFKKADLDERGKMVAAFAIADIQGFRTPQFEIMLGREIERIRDNAPSAKASTSPWKTDEEAMWRKTVLRRLCKFLPTKRESPLKRAIGLDEQLDAGRTQDLRARADDLAEVPVVDGTAEPDSDHDGEGGKSEESGDGNGD